MSSLEDLMVGIETRLQTIPGLNTSPVEPDNIMPPHAIVGVPPVPTYSEALARGKMSVQPTITIFTSKALDRPGQMRLAAFAALAGPSSIPAAFVADRTLGGAVEDFEVVSFRPLGAQEVAMVSYYGGLFVCRAMINDPS